MGTVTGRATGTEATDPGPAQLTSSSHSCYTTPVAPHRLGSRHRQRRDSITLSDGKIGENARRIRQGAAYTSHKAELTIADIVRGMQASA